jgi:hypothetical protein
MKENDSEDESKDFTTNISWRKMQDALPKIGFIKKLTDLPEYFDLEAVKKKRLPKPEAC